MNQNHVTIQAFYDPMAMAIFGPDWFRLQESLRPVRITKELAAMFGVMPLRIQFISVSIEDTSVRDFRRTFDGRAF